MARKTRLLPLNWAAVNEEGVVIRRFLTFAEGFREKPKGTEVVYLPA